jgi:hypothetical protein
MRNENEIVDTRLMLRIICGLISAAGACASVFSFISILSGNQSKWMAALALVGSCYGIFLFGSYAITGKFPLKIGDKKS